MPQTTFRDRLMHSTNPLHVLCALRKSFLMKFYDRIWRFIFQVERGNEHERT